MKNAILVKVLAMALMFGAVAIPQAFSQCISSIGTTITVPCNIHPDSIPKPNISNMEGCGTVTSVTQVLPAQPPFMNGPTAAAACDSVCFSKQIRTWTIVRTGMANLAYKDTICYTAITLDDVVCPRDTVIFCPPGINVVIDTSIAALGSPLKSGGVCNILQSGPVRTLWNYSGPGCYKISREWTLIDWCDNMATPRVCRQFIEIVDTIDPVIDAQEDFGRLNIKGDQCTADYKFPPASINDNCTPSLQLKVTISVAGQVLIGNGGYIYGIPIGIHQVIYTVEDKCTGADGMPNSSADTGVIEIYDGVGPLAFCKGNKIVQINESGMVTLPSSAFNDGSFDRCSPPVSIKVKRMNDLPKCVVIAPSDALLNNPFNHFADNVKFCCADHGTDVMVIMRVYQGIVPGGPVSLDATYMGLPHTDCMTSVKVLDKVGPTITCPELYNIDCRELSLKRVKSLTDYGAPVVTDMCLDTVWIDSISRLDQCLVGDITRRIYARDDAGNTTYCDQIIRVSNSDPFDATDTSDWVWPKDTTFFICSASTLPAVTGLPILKDPSCAKVTYNYTDEVYEFAPGACKKIVRKWTVADWCQIDPYVSNSGRWSKSQKIVVMDTAKPVITVPANFMVNNFDSVCGPALVTVPLPSATDCTPGPSLEWTFTLDLLSDGLNIIQGQGRNASQMMPNGIHKLVFSVNDKCGNISKGTTIITVKDAKKPTPVAIHGLATDVGLMNGVAMVRVWARLFFLPGSAFDNCTPFANLKFSYSANTADTVRTYTCDSVGTRNVRLWVTDLAGNQDVVNTYILIQNNMGACTSPGPAPSLRTVGIQGEIMTEAGKSIDQVNVKIMNGEIAMPDAFIAAGKFSAKELIIGQAYNIIPKKDINPMNGVSTIDMIMMQKHILGIQSLPTAYKMIAADIDRSGEVDAADLVELRKLILGLDKTFTKNESWRFVDGSYKFNSITSALHESFKEKYSIVDLQHAMAIHFVGVKIGDVNESSLGSELQNLESREQKSPIVLNLKDQYYNSGDIVRMDITGTLDFIHGMQLSMTLDQLDLIDIESGVLNRNNIHTHIEGQYIKLTAAESVVIQHRTDRPWYTLIFKAKKSGHLMQSVELKSNVQLVSEVYDAGLQASPIQFKWHSLGSDKLVLEQNRPNPFVEFTMVNYYLPQAAKVTLKIMDVNGRLLYHQQVQAGKGQNNWKIDQSIFRSNGIYYYKVESPFGTDASKMILMNQ